MVNKDILNYQASPEFRPTHSILERRYEPEVGKLAELIKIVKDNAPCVKIIYKFNSSASKRLSIFFTANFDTACVEAVDTLFQDATALRCFNIERFEPANGEFSGFIFHSEIDQIADTLSPNDLKFDIFTKNGKRGVVFYLRKEVSEDAKTNISQTIFGERLLLKEIGDLKFVYDKTGSKGVMSYQEVRMAFGLK